ncbi:hypothetical protein GCM10025880_05620 [Methylorubrum aminovorans]|nr:hypothetical protein GCM10025880_05620 [Methylorubrum aminovorans]
MRLHIDRQGAGTRVQARLVGNRHDRDVGACEAAGDDAARQPVQGFEQAAADRGIGRKPRLRIEMRGDDDVTRPQGRIEAAGDPEADDRAQAVRGTLVERPPQARGIAAGLDRLDAGARGDAGLAGKTHHRQNRTGCHPRALANRDAGSAGDGVERGAG